MPKINEVWDRDIPPEPDKHRGGISATAQIEIEVKRAIYCELKRAVYSAEKVPVEIEVEGNKKIVKKDFIPLDWGAQVSISLQVDESTALNPGVALNEPLPTAMSRFAGLPAVATMQSFSLGLGGTLSSTATRIDKSDSFWTVGYLAKRESDRSSCKPENDPIIHDYGRPSASSPFILLESSLGIENWLESAMGATVAFPSYAGTSKIADFNTPAGYQPDTMSLEIKFIIVSSGSINPTWRLVRVSADTGALPLFATGRTRTHDVIITIGPNKTETYNTHLASQIAAAITSSRPLRFDQ